MIKKETGANILFNSNPSLRCSGTFCGLCAVCNLEAQLSGSQFIAPIPEGGKGSQYSRDEVP